MSPFFYQIYTLYFKLVPLLSRGEQKPNSGQS
jgi:hypothetical protein